MSWALPLCASTGFLSLWFAVVSREGNRNCIWMDFYDAHDIWHILSAGGLFFSSVFLLTLDDNLLSKKRKDIHVF
eukprot:m.164658 g.164658  ORF g.164658 m.164658 type:complete len:75 (+) comp10315_c0_seq2:2359-2583(+)